MSDKPLCATADGRAEVPMSVERLRKLADAQENGPYVGLKTNREALRWAADRIDCLEAALREARSALEDWNVYATEWMRERHDLASDFAAIDKALEP